MTGDTGVWIIAGLEAVAALGIAVFWVTWFREEHDQEWLPPGYVEHERVFVFPDALLVVLLVVSASLLVAGAPLGRSLSLVCAGMLAFLGIIDAAYFWQNGLFARKRGGVANAAVVVGVLVLSVALLVLLACPRAAWSTGLGGHGPGERSTLLVLLRGHARWDSVSPPADDRHPGRTGHAYPPEGTESRFAPSRTEAGDD